MNKNVYWKRHFIPTAIVTLVLVGLIALGGYIAYRAGYTQGMVINQQTSSVDQAPWTLSSPGIPGPYPGFTTFSVLTGLRIVLLIGLVILVFTIISRVLMFRSFRPCTGRGADYWAAYWIDHPPAHHHGQQATPKQGNEEKPDVEKETDKKS